MGPMARYEVIIDVAHGPRVSRIVRARCAEAAYQAVRSGLIEAGVEPGARELSTVWRLGLLRGSLIPLGSGDLPGIDDGDGDDGTAGVREPRRPNPAPPSLRVALIEPREESPTS
jgi:hypothetical protein